VFINVFNNGDERSGYLLREISKSIILRIRHITSQINRQTARQQRLESRMASFSRSSLGQNTLNFLDILTVPRLRIFIRIKAMPLMAVWCEVPASLMREKAYVEIVFNGNKTGIGKLG
jgi:hypothetical protein